MKEAELLRRLCSHSQQYVTLRSGLWKEGLGLWGFLWSFLCKCTLRSIQIPDSPDSFALRKLSLCAFVPKHRTHLLIEENTGVSFLYETSPHHLTEYLLLATNLIISTVTVSCGCCNKSPWCFKQQQLFFQSPKTVLLGHTQGVSRDVFVQGDL